MQKGVNPWTGKAKTSKSSGLLNVLIDQHYPQLQPTHTPNPYLDHIRILDDNVPQQNIEEYRQFFDLQVRMGKLKQIDEWIDQVDAARKNKKVEEMGPIDSSYVYVPLHSHGVFNQLLKDCAIGGKEALLRDEDVHGIRQEVKEMERVLGMNTLLMGIIL